MRTVNKPTPTASPVLLRRLIRDYLRPHFGRVALAMVCMGIAAAMTASLAKLIEPMMTRIFAASTEAALLPVAFGVMLAFAMRGASTYAHSVIMNDVGQRIVAEIQRQTFGHLVEADLVFFHKNPAGSLISSMISDIGIMRTAVAEVLTSFGRSSLTLIFLIAVMFQKDWRLALVCFAVFPLSGIYVSRLGRRLRRISGNTQAELAVFSTFLNQVFQSMRHVKAYGMERFEAGRAEVRITELYNLAHKVFRVSSLSQPVSEILSGFATLGLILYGGHEVFKGRLTPGGLFTFIGAFFFAYEPLKRAAKLNGVLQTGLAAAERVFNLIDQRPTLVDAPAAQPLALNKAAIRLENVGFSYDGDRQALSDFTIDVPAGQTVALVGPSGAGKSTILNLIPRFYEVTQGRIMIDGQDIRDVTLASLRQNMALVSQDVSLFDDTVTANILYGRLGASEAEIVEAAKAAAAHEFILNMPQGYNTKIGDNGVLLSGGQRQRLAIARAMLRDAPILLLDEATSALDAESERIVQTALKTLRTGRTTIVIAHRLSTVIDADIIYVMEEGRVAESGSHAALIDRGGLYSRLYGLQAQSFGPDIRITEDASS